MSWPSHRLYGVVWTDFPCRKPFTAIGRMTNIILINRLQPRQFEEFSAGKLRKLRQNASLTSWKRRTQIFGDGFLKGLQTYFGMSNVTKRGCSGGASGVPEFGGQAGERTGSSREDGPIFRRSDDKKQYQHTRTHTEIASDIAAESALHSYPSHVPNSVMTRLIFGERGYPPTCLWVRRLLDVTASLTENRRMNRAHGGG